MKHFVSDEGNPTFFVTITCSKNMQNDKTIDIFRKSVCVLKNRP